MKFENTEVWGFEHAIRGIRNAWESWDKSDSQKDGSGNFIIGTKDMELAQKLIRAGSTHRKFMRQIFVSVDITAPLYWWKEFDTYKIGTTANSTGTMSKLSMTQITLKCFEMDDYNEQSVMSDGLKQNTTYMWEKVIESCEKLRVRYLITKDKKYWKELIRILPESWLQKRTVTMNYENILSICSKDQRRNHKLNEWSGIDNPNLPNFVSWAHTLPCAKDLIFLDEKG